MLVLRRKAEQAVNLSGGITVRVLKVQGGQVRLGFEAPAEIHIVRAELGAALSASVPLRYPEPDDCGCQFHEFLCRNCESSWKCSDIYRRELAERES